MNFISEEKLKDSLDLPVSSLKLKRSNDTDLLIAEKWENDNVYLNLIKRNKNIDSPVFFVIHLGPPFANGPYHLGHTVNIILKDIIARYHNFQGKVSPVIMGWDVHGLPIEKKVLSNNADLQLNIPMFRNLCKEYSLEQIEVQRKQTKKLAIFTDYSNFYQTESFLYQYEELNVLSTLVKKGYIFRSLMPISWSCTNRTALAINEIEYIDKIDTSLYFFLKLVNDFKGYKDLNLVAWTTQPWTIVCNRLIAIKSNASYSILININLEGIIVLSSLISKFVEKGFFVKEEFLGSELINLNYIPPYHTNSEKTGYFIVDGHYFIEENEGTGIVHIAPSFGPEDFIISKKYNIDNIECPVNDSGYFVQNFSIKEIAGLNYNIVNKWVINDLEKKSLVFSKEYISHSYPCDWRDKSPLIYRLTEQWFIDILPFKEKILNDIEQVKWISSNSSEKMKNLIESRNEWCISRQRIWGTPIPSIIKANGENIIFPEIVDYLANLVKKHGSSIWFEDSMLEILRKNFPNLVKKGDTLSRETLDPWFDSGCSHLFFLNNNEIPEIDLYLEGIDQYRGWFNSSLIISQALNEKNPYKQVFSHGFVVDEDGKKMSKSVGNVISPDYLIDKFGTDIIRLWVFSLDVKDKDIRVSDNIIKSFVQPYQKIRNSLRFIIGCLKNLSKVEELDLSEVDYFILFKFSHYFSDYNKEFSSYSFSSLYNSLKGILNNELSFYFEVIKDPIYCEPDDSLRKKQILFTLYKIFSYIISIISPICPLLVEEVFINTSDDFKKIFSNDSKTSIHLLRFNLDIKFPININFIFEKLEKFFFPLKTAVYRKLESLRNEKEIGSFSEASVDIYIGKKYSDFFSSIELKQLLIVSEVNLFFINHEIFISDIKVKKTLKKKCNRCRDFCMDKLDLLNPLCIRCSKIINA